MEVVNKKDLNCGKLSYLEGMSTLLILSATKFANPVGYQQALFLSVYWTVYASCLSFTRTGQLHFAGFLFSRNSENTDSTVLIYKNPTFRGSSVLIIIAINS